MADHGRYIREERIKRAIAGGRQYVVRVHLVSDAVYPFADTFYRFDFTEDGRGYAFRFASRITESFYGFLGALAEACEAYDEAVSLNRIRQ